MCVCVCRWCDSKGKAGGVIVLVDAHISGPITNDLKQLHNIKTFDSVFNSPCHSDCVGQNTQVLLFNKGSATDDATNTDFRVAMQWMPDCLGLKHTVIIFCGTKFL